ncbi:MAG: NAD regulator [Acidobacteriota bacterium]
MTRAGNAGRQIVLDLHAVIVAVAEEVPRILTVSRRALAGDPGEEVEALPFGPLDPAGDRTLELGLREWVREQTGLQLGYVEQLYTFGDRDRGVESAEERVISIAYLALVGHSAPSGSPGARWRGIYQYFPWEDWRRGRPKELDAAVIPGFDAWVASVDDAESRRQRRERADIAFGLGGSRWDGNRVLPRYELLYEVGLVDEASWDRDRRPAESGLGRPMALDHRRMVATALGRLRGKIQYRPVVFEVLPETFTLLRLQRVVEAFSGMRLHKQNFRRLVERGGLVEGTGRRDTGTGGRPAELFRFRREVLRERPTPGVGLPGARPGSA